VDRLADGVLVVFGPGAALVTHDVSGTSIYEAYAEAAVAGGVGCNLGARPNGREATTRRLFYIDCRCSTATVTGY